MPKVLVYNALGVVVHIVSRSYVCFTSLQVGQKVNDLYEDLRDGSRLLMLIELLTGEKLVPNMGTRHCTNIQQRTTGSLF